MKTLIKVKRISYTEYHILDENDVKLGRIEDFDGGGAGNMIRFMDKLIERGVVEVIEDKAGIFKEDRKP